MTPFEHVIKIVRVAHPPGCSRPGSLADLIVHYSNLLRRAAEDDPSLTDAEVDDLITFENARRRLDQTPCTCNAGTASHQNHCALSRWSSP